MNYITEILGFNDSLLTKPLAAGQIALWYALMYINNKCSWAEWFTAPNRTLESLTGLERSSIYRARNELKLRGFIDFRSNGTKACSYKMLTCCTEQQPTQQGTQQPTQQPTQQGTQQPTQPLNKQNKTKQKQCANALFEELWSAYPNKKGKGQVSDAKKLALLSVGREEMLRAIRRYLSDLKKDEWRKPQNGSTFFNSGYVDYLGKNYQTGQKSSYDGVPSL